MSVAIAVIVIFLKAWRGYAPGEIAGFDEETADGLFAGGYAEEYSDEESSKAPAVVDSKKNKPPASKGAVKSKASSKAQLPQTPAPLSPTLPWEPGEGGGGDGTDDDDEGGAGAGNAEGGEGVGSGEDGAEGYGEGKP